MNISQGNQTKKSNESYSSWEQIFFGVPQFPSKTYFFQHISQ